MRLCFRSFFQFSYCGVATSTSDVLPVSMSVTGHGAQLLSLQMYSLGSAWETRSVPALPSISVQPHQ